MTGAKPCPAGAAACAALALAAAGCGGTASAGTASGPRTDYPVQVVAASWPSHQRLAQRTQLVIAVRNVSRATIPDIAVTVTTLPYGTAARAFSRLIPPQPGLASRSRPIWIVDRPPGRCVFACLQGGAGGAVSAYSNTWALGALRSGATASFRWALTAVAAGRWRIAYRVSAGLDGKQFAVRPGGARPVAGTFDVTILERPPRPYVTASGQVLYTP